MVPHANYDHMTSILNGGINARDSATRRPLVADRNGANGGIGVSYSNVVISGGLNVNGNENIFIAKKDADYQDPRQVRAGVSPET